MNFLGYRIYFSIYKNAHFVHDCKKKKGLSIYKNAKQMQTKTGSLDATSQCLFVVLHSTMQNCKSLEGLASYLTLN